MKKYLLLALLMLFASAFLSCSKTTTTEDKTLQIFEMQDFHLGTDVIHALADDSAAANAPIQIQDIGIWYTVLWIKDQAVYVVDKENLTIDTLHDFDLTAFETMYDPYQETMVFFTKNTYTIINENGIHPYSLSLHDNEFIHDVGIIDLERHSVTVYADSYSQTVAVAPNDQGLQYTKIFDSQQEKLWQGEVAYYSANVFSETITNPTTHETETTFHQFYANEMRDLGTYQGIPSGSLLSYNGYLILTTYVAEDAWYYHLVTDATEGMPEPVISFGGIGYSLSIIDEDYLKLCHQSCVFYDPDFHQVQTFTYTYTAEAETRALDEQYYVRVSLADQTVAIYDYGNTLIRMRSLDVLPDLSKVSITYLDKDLFLIDMGTAKAVWDGTYLTVPKVILNTSSNAVYYVTEGDEGPRIFCESPGRISEILASPVIDYFDQGSLRSYHFYANDRFTVITPSEGSGFDHIDAYDNNILIYAGDIIAKNGGTYLIHTTDGSYAVLCLFDQVRVIVSTRPGNGSVSFA